MDPKLSRTTVWQATVIVGALSLWFATSPARGLQYVNKQATVTAGQSTQVARDCPGGGRAVGGGIRGPKFAEQRVSSVGPYDDADPDNIADDGWAARVDGFALSVLELKLFVVCARGHYEHVQHLDFPIPAGVGLGVTSGLCFPGTRPIGGGGYSTPAWSTMRVSASRPLDGNDQDLDPDDGWVAAVHNASGQQQYLDSIAICGEGDYKYVRGYETVGGGDQGAARVRCKGGTQVAGGGFAATGLSSQLALSSMYPRDGADADMKPDDVWVARIDDFSGSDRTLTAYAVCKG